MLWGLAMKTERPGATRYAKHKYDTIMGAIDKKKEIKKEFEDYLNNSCERYKEGKDDNLPEKTDRR